MQIQSSVTCTLVILTSNVCKLANEVAYHLDNVDYVDMSFNIAESWPPSSEDQLHHDFLNLLQ